MNQINQKECAYHILNISFEECGECNGFPTGCIHYTTLDHLEQWKLRMLDNGLENDNIGRLESLENGGGI